MVKQLRQVAGADKVKVEDFKQGLFAVTPAEGAQVSEEALSEAVRRSGFTLAKIVSPEGESPAREASGRPIDQAEQERKVADARQAFRQGEYRRACALLKESIEKLPDKTQADKAGRSDAGQLLSLANFAVADYDEASAAAHAALHRGKPWDWAELARHYRKVDEYTRHLRRLEKMVREGAGVDARFLLGYHYLMLSYKDAAAAQFQRVLKINTNDELAAELLGRLKQTTPTQADKKSRGQP